MVVSGGYVDMVCVKTNRLLRRLLLFYGSWLAPEEAANVGRHLVW